MVISWAEMFSQSAAVYVFLWTIAQTVTSIFIDKIYYEVCTMYL